MAGKMNRTAYEQLIREDLEWLLRQPRTLERDHIERVVERSPEHEYRESPPEIRTEHIEASIDGWDSDFIDIRWSWQGKGFGQLLIQKTAGGVVTDSETMSRESVRRILAAVAESLRLKHEEERDE